MSPKNTLMFGALVALQMAACAQKETQTATAPAKPAGPSMEAKQLAADEQAPFVAEFSFDKGKSALKANAQKQLAKLIKESNIPAQSADVKIIAWADQEYPSVHTKKLNTDQVELANHRGQTLKTFFETKGITEDVQVYNMAERPGMLAEMFSTPNARIKRALEVAGIPNTNTSVKNPEKAGKSIVMIIPK